VYQFKLLANGDLAPSTMGNPNPKKFFGQDQALNGRLRDIAISNDGTKIYLINNGGTSTDKITVYTVNSTTNVLNNNYDLPGIELYPNPSTNIMNIKGVEHLYGYPKVDIFTSYGKLILTDYDRNQIDVSSLRIGLYFVIVTYDER